jgi:dolichyl-phosphate beta-glucosyltransferase
VTRPPALSLVIPAFNEEKRLPVALARIAEWLGSRKPLLSAEVLVVDDGSDDRTAAVAEKTAAGLGLEFRLVRLPHNRGKGAAVRAGVMEAAGERILVTDADLSTPIEELEKLLSSGAPVAIGSRGIDATLVKQRQSLFRVASGKLFNVLVRVLAVSGIRDTQCGFKLFRRDAAREIFSRARVDRFAFDVEALLLARRLGYAIAEVPVLWFNSPDTRVGLGGGLEAFAALFRIRWIVSRTMRARPAPLRPERAPPPGASAGVSVPSRRDSDTITGRDRRCSMKPKVGVVLSGCGVYDGAEIHESVLTLLALDRARRRGRLPRARRPAEARRQPPDGPARRGGDAERPRGGGEDRARSDEGPRRVRRRHARRPRPAGRLRRRQEPLRLRLRGAGCEVHPEVARVVRAVHAAGKPVGAVCIAPVILARLLGDEKPKVTIGSDPGTAAAIGKMGGEHVPCGGGGAVVDEEKRLVTSPAYMLDSPISEVSAGIEKLVAELLRMARG